MEEDEAWQHRQRVGHLTLARAVLHRAVLTLPPLPSSVQLRRQARQTAQQQQQAAHASSQDVDMRNTTTDEHELDDLARVLAQSTSVAQLALAPLSVSWPDDDDDEVEVESDGQHQGAVMMDLDDSTAASTSAVGCQKAAQESQAPSSRELTRLIARALHLAAHAHHQLACQHQQQRDHAPSSTAPVHANSETRDSWFEFELPKLAGINGGGEIVTDQAAYHDSHAMMTTSTTADSTGSTTGRSSGIASLDSLQLCLVRFHREATRDLVEAAEDEFHFRREMAFSQGEPLIDFVKEAPSALWLSFSLKKTDAASTSKNVSRASPPRASPTTTTNAVASTSQATASEPLSAPQAPQNLASYGAKAPEDDLDIVMVDYDEDDDLLLDDGFGDSEQQETTLKEVTQPPQPHVRAAPATVPPTAPPPASSTAPPPEQPQNPRPSSMPPPQWRHPERSHSPSMSPGSPAVSLHSANALKVPKDPRRRYGPPADTLQPFNASSVSPSLSPLLEQRELPNVSAATPNPTAVVSPYTTNQPLVHFHPPTSLSAPIASASPPVRAPGPVAPAMSASASAPVTITPAVETSPPYELPQPKIECPQLPPLEKATSPQPQHQRQQSHKPAQIVPVVTKRVFVPPRKAIQAARESGIASSDASFPTAPPAVANVRALVGQQHQQQQERRVSPVATSGVPSASPSAIWSAPVATNQIGPSSAASTPVPRANVAAKAESPATARASPLATGASPRSSLPSWQDLEEAATTGLGRWAIFTRDLSRYLITRPPNVLELRIRGGRLPKMTPLSRKRLCELHERHTYLSVLALSDLVDVRYETARKTIRERDTWLAVPDPVEQPNMATCLAEAVKVFRAVSEYVNKPTSRDELAPDELGSAPMSLAVSAALSPTRPQSPKRAPLQQAGAETQSQARPPPPRKPTPPPREPTSLERLQSLFARFTDAASMHVDAAYSVAG